MSTYLEVVIQERSTDGRAILTHRHMIFEHPRPGELAATIAASLEQTWSAPRFRLQVSDPLRPCLLCWQLTQEEKHDT